MSPRTRKVLSFLAIAVAGLVIGLVIASYVRVKLSLPPQSGSIQVRGIQSPVEIMFDSMGVPQIWAETEQDAYFALGWQHAADRIFQMDLTRHVSQGRLAELTGSGALDFDQEQRRIGHQRIARRAINNLDTQTREKLEAYTAGINAYKRSARTLPVEYALLPIEFEPWTLLDCLTLLSFQTWYANGLMNRDEFYLELDRKIGPEKAATLSFPYPDWAPVTVPQDQTQGSVSTPVERPVPELANLPTHPSYSMLHSSNAWVASPAKTSSGHAMIASDPHLEIHRLPQFWYAVGLHIGKDSAGVLGITTPGLPYVVMGHNGRAAWAFTVGGLDLIDFIPLAINPDDSMLYGQPGAWERFEIVTDSFRIAGYDSLTSMVTRLTEYGPVIKQDAADNRVLALHWTGYDVDLAAAATNGFRLHSVGDFAAFRRIVTGLGALDANMMYADKDGNIGYQLASPIPLRSLHPDTAGTTQPFGWSGYLPFDQTPHAYNPSQGWLASCNNKPSRQTDLRGYFFATRILRITELLDSGSNLTPEDFRNFQMDQVDRYLWRFRDLAAHALNNLNEKARADSMLAWDGDVSAGSREAAIIIVFLEQLRKLTFQDELGSLHLGVPARWIEQIREIDSAGWFDDISSFDKIETRDDIAASAMRLALAITDGRVWGDLLRLSMNHPMASLPIVGDLLTLNTEPVKWGGSAGSLNASFYQPLDDSTFAAVAGPSWRFVLDFADVDKATMVLPAGNSGNPAGDHFLDFHPMWKSGERWTVPFHYEPVKQRAKSVLTLKPRPGVNDTTAAGQSPS